MIEEILTTYGIYIAIVFVIHFLILGLKKTFKSFFEGDVGNKILYFLPVLFGAALGLFLPEESLKIQLLYGAALGTSAQTIYTWVTKLFIKKMKDTEVELEE